MKRSLPVGDENNRLMNISLGCFIENLIIAADYFGYEYEVVDNTVNFKKIPLRQKPRGNKGHLLHSITKRVTNRGKYKKDPPDSKLLEKIKKTENLDVQLSVIKNVRLKEKVANVVIRAGIEATANRDFRRELSNHVKNNLTPSKTGMPAFGYEIPTLISFIAPLMIKHLNMNKINQRKDLEMLTNHTPLFLVLSVKEDRPKYWIKTGRVFQKIALYCTQGGVAVQPMAAPIQIGNYSKAMQKKLNTNYRPVIFSRLGYPLKEFHHSPRLDIGTILVE